MTQAADAWGESREEGYRLGFVGVLAVRVDINLEDRLATIVAVKLRRDPRD